ncbi:aminotransferase class V-fold PLP-dependent enzyme [Ornithinimicrobium cavernae]|uniref:aminotransferase class V-fold PLP-dependent enzyme n=1 Tax=Ornithinimicrobium cavernae TaxID=2666047 RepID=UPI0013798C9B|nr:aminotransferase class V-fold PLP-dependent enzyme [Ornithinimicrobium cavernae]
MGVGAASLAVASPAAAQTAPAFTAPARDANFWRAVRREFILDKNVLFMNVGTVGSPPKDVLRELQVRAEEVSRDAISGYGSFDEIRAELAMAYGVDTDEFAISDNTSDGMAKIFAGLNLGPGDEVLTTNHEHSGGNSPLRVAEDRHGVTTVRVTLPVGDDQTAEDYVALFEERITSRTKLIMFSAPTYLTGTMLPIRLLCELAQQHGIPTLVDAAHVPGMMAYNFRDLGADFIAGAGAKWQCGPAGSGVLYVRNRVTAANPNPLPTFWPTISSGYSGQGARTADAPGSYDIGKTLQSCGNGQRVVYDGFLAAHRMWEEIGRERIQDYVVGLSTTLKEQIVERWGRQALYSPVSDERLRCALTSFNPFQDATDVMNQEKSVEFVARLKDQHGIVIRNTTTPAPSGDVYYPMRVSTHLFHNAGDVDRVVEAAWQVSQQVA